MSDIVELGGMADSLEAKVARLIKERGLLLKACKALLDDRVIGCTCWPHSKKTCAVCLAEAAIAAAEKGGE